MRRLMLTAAVAAVVTGVIIGPLAATAAAPYLYGCTPVAHNTGSATVTQVLLYNGQVVTANVTAKAQAHDGTNLNASLGITTTFTIAPGNTRWIEWTNPVGNPATSTTIPSTLRVVSDQPLAASTVETASTSLADTFPCSYLHP